MTKDELLLRAARIEELGCSLLEHAQLLRQQSSKTESTQVFLHDITSNLLVFTEALLAAREHRLSHRDGNLFGEPAWDMLLFLFRAFKLGRVVTADQVCRSSGAFPSTTRRWLAVLIDHGLVESCNDAQVDTLTPIRLSELGEIQVTKVLVGMQGEFLQHGWSGLGTS